MVFNSDFSKSKRIFKNKYELINYFQFILNTKRKLLKLFFFLIEDSSNIIINPLFSIFQFRFSSFSNNLIESISDFSIRKNPF